MRPWKKKGLLLYWCICFNLLHPNISMHILDAVIDTFCKVLTRRICFIIKSLFSWWSFSLFSWPYWLIQEWYCQEKLYASHSQGWKGQYILILFCLFCFCFNDFIRAILVHKGKVIPLSYDFTPETERQRLQLLVSCEKLVNQKIYYTCLLPNKLVTFMKHFCVILLMNAFILW